MAKKRTYETIGQEIRRTGPAKKKVIDAGPSGTVTPKLAKSKGPSVADMTKVAKAAKASDVTKDVKRSNGDVKPTVTIATELQTAFDFFNDKLFRGELPPCMIRVERLKKYRGYFRPKQWGTDKADDSVHEIVLDPSLFRSRDLKDTLSTLAHEMAHLKDEVDGTAPKKVYHGKSWVRIMEQIGLTPVILNAKMERTGKPTGVNSAHEIVPHGVFDVACDMLMNDGYVLTWSAVIIPEKAPKDKTKKGGVKSCHECPTCASKAWGKSSLKLFCANDHDPELMNCDDREDDETSEDGDE